MIHVYTAVSFVYYVASCGNKRTMYIKPYEIEEIEAWFTYAYRSDCVSILSECIDYERLPKRLTVEALCSMLSPQEESAPCISLVPFLGM